MAKSHGKKARLSIQSAAGVLTDISPYINDTGLARSVDTAEVTVLNVDDKSYVAGLRGATVPLNGFFDPTFDALMEGILGMERTFQYDPAGSTSGLPRYTGSMLVTAYETSTGTGGAASVTGSLQVTGAVTRGTVP